MKRSELGRRSFFASPSLLPVLREVIGVTALLMGIASLTSCSSGGETTRTATPVADTPATRNTPPRPIPERFDTVSTINGLRYIDYVAGDGRPITRGMAVLVDYAGYLVNGELFDTSLDSIGRVHNFDRGGYPFQPIQFTVGSGDVILGWDEGLLTDMRVGGRRRLIIPPNLAYGPQGRPGIPPNATLIFDVHVLSGK